MLIQRLIFLVLSLSLFFAVCAQAADSAQDPLIARGRYLSVIGGCNDCHTPHFAHSGGKVAEEHWLKGDIYGFRGPWGTTYPINIRLYFSKLTEEEWVKAAPKLQSRPPMPTYVFRWMSEEDLRALYRFVRQLGELGNPAPEYVLPFKEPTNPYFPFVPVMPKLPEKK